MRDFNLEAEAILFIAPDMESFTKHHSVYFRKMLDAIRYFVEKLDDSTKWGSYIQTDIGDLRRGRIEEIYKETLSV